AAPAPAPAAAAEARALDAATASRTAINPVVQGVKRLPPASNAIRTERDAKPSSSAIALWGWVAGISVAIAALAGGAMLLWSQFSPADPASVAKLPSPPAANPPEIPLQPAAPTVSEQPPPQPVVAEAPAPAPAVVAPSVAAAPPGPSPLPAPAPAEMPLAANPAPNAAPVAPV